MEPLWSAAVSAASGIVGAIIGAYSAYLLQGRQERIRSEKRRNRLVHVLMTDVVTIAATATDESLLIKHRRIGATAWDALRFEFAECAADNAEWELFETFYAECELWNRFIEQPTSSTNLVEGVKPLKNAADRIVERYKNH